MILIETIKSQLESEGYQVNTLKMPDEDIVLSIIKTKCCTVLDNMKSILVFTADGSKIKEVTAFLDPVALNNN